MHASEVIEWTEKWSVEIEELDKEHKGLVDIINEIISLHVNDKNTRKLRTAMNRLMQYTSHHLKREERFLELNRYPEINEHKALHLKLMYDVLAMKTTLLDGHYDHVSGEELKKFLIDKWLMEHIITEDKKYAEYFKRSPPKVKGPA